MAVLVGVAVLSTSTTCRPTVLPFGSYWLLALIVSPPVPLSSSPVTRFSPSGVQVWICPLKSLRLVGLPAWSKPYSSVLAVALAAGSSAVTVGWPTKS